MPHTKQVPGSGPRFGIQNFIRFSICNQKHLDNLKIVDQAVAKKNVDMY